MATRYSTLAAAALAVIFFTPPALAAKTCVIVVAADRPSSAEIYRHELAHCHGWKHPDNPLTVARYKAANGGKSYQPPQHLVKPYPNLIDHWVTTKEARQLCGGHLGCQYFE